MAKTIKIIALSLICVVMLSAIETNARGVYFNEGTPYLVEISQLLDEHDYELSTDSLKAHYNGELFCYMEGKDSIRCEVHLKQGQNAAFILDSFITEPADEKSVRHSVARFSVWMLLLNALTAILFFARST